MNFTKICDQTILLVKKVGQYIREQSILINASNIETKSFHSYVTYVDKTAESMLVEGLRLIFPTAGYITEESTVEEIHQQYMWIVDPLDGTTNFIHGLSPVAISIALAEDKDVLVGIVYEISLDECFYATKGGLSYLNGQPIRVSGVLTVEHSLIATGFPYYVSDRISPFVETLMFFMENSHGIRRLGSAATDLAYVACGRFEAFYEYGLSSWDVAAGFLIVKQAGGRVSDFSGGSDFIFGKEIIATNGHIYKEFQGEVQKKMC